MSLSFYFHSLCCIKLNPFCNSSLGSHAILLVLNIEARILKLHHRDEQQYRQILLQTRCLIFGEMVFFPMEVNKMKIQYENEEQMSTMAIHQQY